MMVIGIAGGSGSGKTTFVRGLRSRLKGIGMTVLAQDAYYHDRSDLSQLERQALNFDTPEAIDFDLMTAHARQLLAGEVVEQPVYDYLSCTRAEETERLEPAPVIVVDGILILGHAPLRAVMDLSVFLDIPADLRLLQLIERDVAERGRDAQAVLQRYMDTVRPMHLQYVEPSRVQADFVLPHGGRNPVALDMVSGYIRQRLTAQQPSA